MLLDVSSIEVARQKTADLDKEFREALLKPLKKTEPEVVRVMREDLDRSAERAIHEAVQRCDFLLSELRWGHRYGDGDILAWARRRGLHHDGDR